MPGAIMKPKWGQKTVQCGYGGKNVSFFSMVAVHYDECHITQFLSRFTVTGRNTAFGLHFASQFWPLLLEGPASPRKTDSRST